MSSHASTSAMPATLIATQPPDPPKAIERPPPKKRRSKKKELLRRQGVLLSTIKGKEKEAAEEVVEALTPVVRRLYPGLLENYADRAASLASEDEDDEFDDALAKALENVEKKKRMPPPPLGIQTAEIAHCSYVPIDAFIDPVKVVHAFLAEQQQGQQPMSKLKYTLRMTPCRIVCAANVEAVRNAIRAAAIPVFAGLEAKWKRNPTWKIAFQAKSNTEFKKNELLANASELIAGRKIVLDDADVVISVVAVKNYAGIAFLLDYDKLNRYNTAAAPTPARKDQQEASANIEFTSSERAATGTEEFEEVAIPPAAGAGAAASINPSTVSDALPERPTRTGQTGSARPSARPSSPNGLNIRKSPLLPPRPPNVLPREPPTTPLMSHLRPTGLSLPRPPVLPNTPSSSGTKPELPPWKLSLPVRRDADDRCWHCGAKEEHFGRPQVEIAEEWARLEKERERLEALRQQIEAQQGSSSSSSAVANVGSTSTGNAKRKRGRSADLAADSGEAEKRFKNGQDYNNSNNVNGSGSNGNRRHSGSMMKDAFDAEIRPTSITTSAAAAGSTTWWNNNNNTNNDARGFRGSSGGGAPRQDQGDQFRDHLMKRAAKGNGGGWEGAATRGGGSGMDRGGGGRSRGRGARRGGGQGRGALGRGGGGGGHATAHSDPE